MTVAGNCMYAPTCVLTSPDTCVGSAVTVCSLTVTQSVLLPGDEEECPVSLPLTPFISLHSQFLSALPFKEAYFPFLYLPLFKEMGHFHITYKSEYQHWSPYRRFLKS